MSRPCLAHHRVGALDVGAETLAPGAIVTVEGKGLLVDDGEPFGHAPLGFLERGARGDLGAHGVDHVVDVAPEGLEPVAAGDVTVAHDDVREVELSEAVERRYPVLRIAVAHKGRPADDGVARDDDLLPRQVDEHVPLGVRPPEVEEVDLAVAPVELHRLLEGDRRQRRPERPDLGEIRLGEADGGLQPRALGGRPGRGEVGLELGDLLRALADVVLDPLEPLAHHGLARELVGDDLRVRVGGGVHLVAVPVVPVEVRVDHVAHRLRRDLAQPFHDDAGRRGLRVCVDDGHAVVALDDRRVRVHLVGRRGDRDVHAVGDLLDLEPCVAGALSLVTAAVHHRHSSFPDSPRGAHRRASAAAARLARPRSQTRLAARSAEPPRPPLGSHDHVPRLASRRAPPSLRGRRSARTTTFPDSPRGALRRASAAAARLARPRSQTRLAARVAEPPPPPLGSHDPLHRRASPGGPRGGATRRAARDLSRSLHRAGGLLAPRGARRGRARGEGLRRRRRDRVREPGRHRARPLLQLSLPLRADGRAARDVPAHDAAGPLDLRGREVLGLQVPGGGRAARVRHRVRQARLVNVQRGVRAGAGARHGAQGRRHHSPARRTLELRAPRHVAHAPLGARDREPHDHRHEPQHPAGRGRARDRLQSRGDPAGGTPARRLHRDRRPRARPVAPRAGGPPRRPVALADEARHLQAMAPSRGVSGGSAMNDARQGRLGRRDFLTGAAGLALAFPCGAGAQPQGGTLTYASTALPPNIEPHMQGLDIWQQRKPLIYENLIWVDESLEAKPELAERWEQRSPTEYVFRLRRGVRFHGGKELDAEDVKYTYDRVRDPKVSPGANDLLVIKQIDVLDAHTVRFVLHAPAATFLINLGGKYNGVIPKGAAGDGRELLTRAMGTGPFGVEEFDPSRRLVLKRHAAYWGPTKPALERIVFQAIPDESSIVAGLRTGQVTMAQFSSALSFQVARGIATLKTIQAPSTRWVVLDLAGDMEPTSKPEARQAIALALDRQAILQIAGAGLGQPLGVLAAGMRAWAMPWQELPNQQRDLARARALLSKAGYPGRVPMKIRNIVGFPALGAALPVIVDNLREASIDVQVETVDGGVWIKDWIVPQSPPTMNEWGGFVDPDQAFHRHFHSAPGGKDFRRWNSKKADELLDAGRATLERAKRKQIYDQVQRLMAEDPITVPLYSPDLLYAMQKSVKGFAPHPTGFLYGLRWVSL